MDEAITQYIKRKYNLLIGERTAEQVKIEVGSAFPLDQPRTMEIKGRDLMEGVPKASSFPMKRFAKRWTNASTSSSTRFASFSNERHPSFPPISPIAASFSRAVAR